MVRRCIDSSVWIAYARGEHRVKDALDGELVTSSLALLEIADHYARDNKEREARSLIAFIESRAEIRPLTPSLCLSAAAIKRAERAKRPKFGIADAVHLATARDADAQFITCDNDFAGMKNVVVVR